MTEWVALLRGVNVAGITIRNAELADVFARLGARDVRTVLASGNVVFAGDAAAARDEVKALIERALAQRFGYDAWIVLITADELRAAVGGFPFDAGDRARQPYIVFCSEETVHTELARAAASLDQDADPVADGVGVLYWNPRAGTTTSSPFGRVLARPRWRSTTTTRNLRTLRKMIG